MFPYESVIQVPSVHTHPDILQRSHAPRRHVRSQRGFFDAEVVLKGSVTGGIKTSRRDTSLITDVDVSDKLGANQQAQGFCKKPVLLR